MTKSKGSSEQLQLRLLVDVSKHRSDIPVALEKKQNSATNTDGQVTLASPASESDMSVYRQISGNYFRSLQKA